MVVGRVRAVRAHPNADRLRLCSVEIGGGAQEEVVCGAANVREGMLVPFAKVGAFLHKRVSADAGSCARVGGTYALLPYFWATAAMPAPLPVIPSEQPRRKVKTSKLRGIKSCGVLCSAGELGLADEVVCEIYKYAVR